MSKTLSQLRVELSNRLGFGSQAGAGIIQAPMLESILQRSQDLLISRYGSQIGSTVPAEPFTDPNDKTSVPEYPLMLKALLTARGHYRQPMEVDADSWNAWKASMKGITV